MKTEKISVDIIIVGAGLVGTSVVVGLQKAGFRIAVLEKHLPAIIDANKNDPRPLTLAAGSQRCLERWGIWSSLVSAATAIQSVHISEKGRLGRVQFTAKEAHLPALGYVVPYDLLQHTLYSHAASQSNVTFISIEKIISLHCDETGAQVEYIALGETHYLSGKLLIVADGTQSHCRKLLNIEIEEDASENIAFIATLYGEQTHSGTAYQRFTSQGSLALLPLSKNHDYRLVWTMRKSFYEEEVKHWPDTILLKTIETYYGGRLGKLKKIEKDSVFPVKMQIAKETIRPSMVLLGNAAYTIYPIAAQGFNLALQDVQMLTQILKYAKQKNMSIGDLSTLERYQQRRHHNQQTIIRWTKLMIQVFRWNIPLLDHVRGMALLGLDSLSFIKEQFMRNFLHEEIHHEIKMIQAPRSRIINTLDSESRSQGASYSYDIAIVGGGMIGLTLALALADFYAIAIIESKNPTLHWEISELDARVSAVHLGTQKFLENLEIWPHIRSEYYSPLERMEVWDELGGGRIYFDATDIGEDVLGFIVENREIVRVLWEKANVHKNIKILAGVSPVALHDDQIILNNQEKISAKFMVGADGAQSWVRQQMSTNYREKPYHQDALIAVVETERPHHGAAYQPFLKTGPLGILPLSNPHHVAMVWSADSRRMEELLSLSLEQFNRELMNAMREQLGRMRCLTDRKCIPLIQRHVTRYVQDNKILIGDAAHTIHPLAGQGANLGFMDAACLAQCLIDDKNNSKMLAKNLRRYERWRKSENECMLIAMNGFKSVFSSKNPLTISLRSAGFNFTDRFSLLKRFFMQTAVHKKIH